MVQEVSHPTAGVVRMPGQLPWQPTMSVCPLLDDEMKTQLENSFPPLKSFAKFTEQRIRFMMYVYHKCTTFRGLNNLWVEFLRGLIFLDHKSIPP